MQKGRSPKAPAQVCRWEEDALWWRSRAVLAASVEDDHDRNGTREPAVGAGPKRAFGRVMRREKTTGITVH